MMAGIALGTPIPIPIPSAMISERVNPDLFWLSLVVDGGLADEVLVLSDVLLVPVAIDPVVARVNFGEVVVLVSAPVDLVRIAGSTVSSSLCCVERQVYVV